MDVRTFELPTPARIASGYARKLRRHLIEMMVVGGRGGTRTRDPLLAKQAHYTRPPADRNGHLATLPYVSVSLTRPVSAVNGRKQPETAPRHDTGMTLAKKIGGHRP